MTFSLPLFFWPAFLRPAMVAETPSPAGPAAADLHADIGLPPVQDHVPADAMALAAVLRDRGHSL